MSELKGFKSDFSTIDKVSDIRRLPRINDGKIRLGIKKKMQKTKTVKGKPEKYWIEYPAEVDYFVVPPAVEAIYGDKPKELEIYVPVNDLNIIFPQAYKWYVKSGIRCLGDGIRARRNNEGNWEEIKCPCKNLKTKDNPKGVCGRVATFLFILRKVNMGGVYQIDTGSIHSIIDIQSGLEYAAELFHSATGERRFNMIPLKLRRIERETHGSGRKETHYTMVVELDMSVDELNQAGQNPRFIQGGKMKFVLAPPKLSESNEMIYDDEEDKKIPPEFEDVTKEEQKKIDKAKKDVTPKRMGEQKDPLKMPRGDLIDWLKGEKGKCYDPTLYDKTKKELFGNTSLKNITLKMFQNLYEKLELNAKIEKKKDEKQT